MNLTLLFQILSITCDNASNNDKMVKHLASIVEQFPGEANQIRCFLHILNLVAKSVLRQFDVKKTTGKDPPNLDDAATALAGLEKELEDDIPALVDNIDDDENELDDEINDGDDSGLGDENDGMFGEEVDDLDASLVPIRLMLTKVSQ